MKKTILVGLSAAALALSVPAPAHAANVYLKHLSDDGYNASFTAKCGDGHVIYIAEGHNSNEYCATVTDVYVHANEEYHCWFAGAWYVPWDATGWHSTNNFNHECVVQRD